MTSTWIGRQRVAILATLFFSCKGIRCVHSLRHRCTCTHTWYKNKTCEDGSTLASTFRLLSIFTVEGLKYNCVGSTKQHHTARPKSSQDNTT